MDDNELSLENETSMTPGVDMARDTMAQFLDAASVDAVYGIPVEHGDTLIIPAAEILSGMGFGIGYGSGTGEPEQKEIGEVKKEPVVVGGSGGGGGGRILSRPVAVVIASPQGVRVEPVIDITKIALAALTAVGFMVGMVLRMMNSKRAFPNDEE